MGLTTIQTIAFILVLLTLVKLVVIIFNKKWWFNKVARPIYRNTLVSSLIFLVLAIVIFFYLLDSGITVTQMMAVTAFVVLLIGFSMVQYGKEVLSFADRIYKKKFNYGTWINILIWAGLAVWTLFEIFSVPSA